VLREGAVDPWIELPRDQEGPYTLPGPGTPLLVMGDLGCLAMDPVKASRPWINLGLRFRDRGNEALALVPSHPGRCPPELAELWTIIPWEKPDGPLLSGDQTADYVRQIITLLSFVIWVEPRMIRAVRRMFPACRWDPGIESLVWQHEAFINRDYEAARFDPQQVARWREELRRVDQSMRGEVYRLVAAMRQDDYQGAWFSELLGLEHETATGLISKAEFDQAREWFDSWSESFERDPASRDPAGDHPTWFREIFPWISDSARGGSVADALNRIHALTRPNDDARSLPCVLDPRRLPGAGEGPLRTFAVSQVGDSLAARPFPGSVESAGSPLGLIRTCNGKIKIEPVGAFWEGGVRPEWAADWGRDPFGAWAAFQVGGVTQKLRWIPPGKFLMGSPDNEEGPLRHEGPQHEVAIESGFWMFETPCTQALWEAVMGKNPSRFPGPERPVEQVNWEDVEDFLTRIATMIPGLRLGLPTEGQWEYACRAGSAAARYGDLDQIAWYSENSGGETHPVALKQPNGWGLHDMLGNVWEWCADAYWGYGTGKSRASARRVIRGGSWIVRALYVRAASRSLFGPSLRLYYLGFRCAEFRTPGPVGRKEKQGAERAGERGGVGAEHPGDRDTASGAGWINLDAPGMDAVSFATLTPVRVSSDVEQIVLRTTTRPKWASAMGRDKYGLWAEFTIEGNAAKQRTERAERAERTAKKKSTRPKVPLGPVRQRLRWIPPGRFLMGSPPDEEGRYSYEGPQHEVTIAEGFWMFDTPCTQALWEALMGENPSEFQSPDRPVENVSWADCRKFVEKINEKFDLEKVDISLSLPSEAQWEYACRAGTTTATYAGPLKIEGANNAPLLHEIAWYGGNSGIDFELSNGYDASEWREKQFEFDKAGTHPVARKKANPWGLYDMLGNVWEWCKDVWVEDYTEKYRAAVSDSASARRVFRGGSWDYDARGVRAAYRSLLGPSSRPINLGFRCAEFRAGREPGERAVRMRWPAGEQRMSTVRLAPRIIHPLSRGNPPIWASEWGQDSYGPWCSLSIDDVTQRLRWIPPGRFLMGSPDDEEGRWPDEGPRHEETIGSGFWMFDTPCTQALWEAVIVANPSRFKSPDRPVENVSWTDCQDFVKRLNERVAGLQLGLPSESQWEYACRAGTETARYRKELGEIAWYNGNSGGKTHAVGGKAPNAWGLHDMLGNVWEWCADPWRSEYTERIAAGSAEQASARRVIRGGSWNYGPRDVRAACRHLFDPSNRFDYLGFRCAELRPGS